MRHRLAGILPRWMIARAANALLWARNGDQRRFTVDAQGRWLNRQPEATFVSPDIFTAHFAQVREAVLDSWCYRYRPGLGDTVIDVGAGIGEDSVIFAKLVGEEGRVIAIEAHPDTFDCLVQTLERSGLTNVTPVQCAISDREGTLVISDTANYRANSVVGAMGGTTVAAQTLDALYTELGIDTVDLLKMNIEGAEAPAMAGMKQIARRTRHMSISCHDFVADAGGGEQFRTRAKVTAALKAKGYAVTFRPDARHPWTRDTIYGQRQV